MTELEIRVCVTMEDSTFASDVNEIKEEKISELLRPSNIKQEQVQLQEKINLLEKKLLEKELAIKVQEKELEKTRKALNDIQREQYQKDTTIDAQREEIEKLRTGHVTQSFFEPKTTSKFFKFVRNFGYNVGYNIVKHNLISQIIH